MPLSPSPTRQAPSSTSSASSQTSSQARLSQISTQLAPMAATAFDANVVPQAPEDPLFGLMAAYRRDEDPKKVDLGIGAYRDNNAKPWILPVVKKASANLVGAPWLLPPFQSSL
jgi:aspartate aminotransferase